MATQIKINGSRLIHENLVLIGVDNHNPRSASKVVMGNFMPFRGNISELLYGLQQDAAGHQTGLFLNNKGVITLSPSPAFTQNKFNGLSRIIVS